MVEWFYGESPTWLVAIVVVLTLVGAAWLGIFLRRMRPGERRDEEKSGEQLIVSAVLGLLALLLGFTFALAIDRFDTRRQLVLEEANDIGTTWLRTQLLDEPHRTRLSRLLEGYTENRIRLATAQSLPQRRLLLAQTNRYHEHLWAATVDAVRPIRHLPVAVAFVESMNATIDIAAARKAARRAHVPPRVLTALLIYMTITAFALGYALLGLRVKWAAVVLLVLLSLSYVLILDIDQPTQGGVRESQEAMEDLLAGMRAAASPALPR
ncbi:MAG: bestrophin-like domain [Allosphingosinicella sp.]